MPSESARASTAAEARFRVQAPNSVPRSVVVVALDGPGADAAADLAARAWRGAAFWHARDFAPAQASRLEGFLADLAGCTQRLVEVVEAADLVVLLTGPAGTEGAALPAIAEAAAARRVTVIGVVVASEPGASALSRSLAALRPHVAMLVRAQDPDYAAAMLEALRA
ncbi:hypothetical protein [Falsiroseomonas oryzae]|uniref:hypothetical protein n=1 Tax=Falsiroseomonas oryzae TaxID=2766473 RepID=UPI0022EB4984|nr:hypothetical protein [Roseomonas sp. MO-31]